MTMDISPLPTTMKIARLDEVGAPENLKIVTVDVPKVQSKEILIKTDLAGLIYGDTEARRGTYFTETVLPFFPGREVAGTIVAVGDEVEDYIPGERVIALILTGGTCAEYVVAPTCPVKLSETKIIPPADIIKIPDEVAFENALPYLVNFRLAHMLFHGSSKVPQGATVLVHGASGGMGSMVTQLGKHHNCQMIATCRTEEEAAFCTRLGAEYVILAGKENYVERVMEITNERGVDFSFNGVGGETLNYDVDILVPFGEIQAYGYVAGKTHFDTFRVGKTVTLKTFSADDFFPTSMFAEATQAMHEWFKNGDLISPGIILPLDEVVEANRLLDTGKVIGKIALRP